MAKRQLHIRASEATVEKLDALTERYGTVTEAVSVAVDRLYREERGVMDRVAQVSWIDELAGNIATNLGEGTAEELVAYAMSPEGRESWGIEIPEWFDDHDRRLLTERVEMNLA